METRRTKMTDKKFTKIANRVIGLLGLDFSDIDDMRNGAAIGEGITEIVFNTIGIDASDVDEILRSRQHHVSLDVEISLDALSINDLLRSMKPCPTCGSDIIAVSDSRAEHKNCVCTVCGEATRRGLVSTRDAISIWNDHCDTWNRVNKVQENRKVVNDTEVE
jgi:transcription elongation factor Elf1